MVGDWTAEISFLGASMILSATFACSSKVAVGMAAMMERTVVGRARNHKFDSTLSVQPVPPSRRISDKRILGFWSPSVMPDSKLVSLWASDGWK